MNKISLKLDGVNVEMEDIRIDARKQSFACSLRARFHDKSDANIPIRECRLQFSDLRQMVSYIRAHVGADTPHTIADSHTFVTYNTDFSLQALAGDLESWSDGNFTIRWMFYCGPNDRSAQAFYVGVEAPVDVAEMLRWCRDLEAIGGELGC